MGWPTAAGSGTLFPKLEPREEVTRMRTGTTGSMLLALLLVLPVCLEAGVLQVPSEYPTITAAIAAAAHGDTILVGPGVYEETVALVKFLTLVSEAGPEETIIDGGGTGEVVVDVGEGLVGSGDRWVVDGFTVRNGYTGVVCMTNTYTAEVFIRDCIVRDNLGDGIYVSDSITTVDGCVVLDNYSDGIFLSQYISVPPAQIRRNLIMGNGWAGISAYCDGDFVIDHNTVIGNEDGIVITRPFPDGPGEISNNIITQNTHWGVALNQPFVPYDCQYVHHNDVWGNAEDVWPGSECEDILIGENGNISSDPRFCDMPSGDVSLTEDSPCVGAGEGGTDLGAYGVGCDLPAVVTEDAVSWGLIKALYR